MPPSNFDGLPGVVSIRTRGEYYLNPVLLYNSSWTSGYADDKPYIEIYENSDKLMSGLTNGLDITLDLELFDSADIGRFGGGIGLLINNKDDYPLIQLNGFFLEPGKLAMIKIKPEIYDISQSASERFDYLDRKCVVKNEIDLAPYFDSYSLPNCLVTATYTEIADKCPGYKFNKPNNGTVLACGMKYMMQIGRWKRVKKSQKQCFPSCQR